ncbi:helix-turn-helix transcriptional regulator [Streptacidiphilus sp. P02-A3a]|uniref:helix-turn-helix domain-containing protein n=1 Tax=Streptacidiphilus sp. P02-A3a TaxID=2704468 RepID=UPI0015F7FF7F|nr:helix-turn-helix domain-containing protein [Streptacidiphilus sp. P02-A3a]
MARWKALPEGLDPTVVQLLVRLRRMKDDSGLSLDQLAVRTGYSVSSWERYLAQTFVYTPMVSVDAPGTPLRICLTAPGNGGSQCFTARTIGAATVAPGTVG